jgi:hypothetical protein
MKPDFSKCVDMTHYNKARADYYEALAGAACNRLRELGEIRLDGDGGEYYWVATGDYLVRGCV